jgi:hypothetical protein
MSAYGIRVRMVLRVTDRSSHTFEERAAEREDMEPDEFALLLQTLQGQARQEPYRQDLTTWEFTRDSGKIHETATVVVSEI